MSDLIQTFYDLGSVYKDYYLSNFNEIESRNIDKIIVIKLPDYSVSICDANTEKNKLFLRKTSSNGGNLFPFLYLSDKLKGGIKKSFVQMKQYANDDNKKEIEKIESQLDLEKIYDITKKYLKNKNYYVALQYNNKYFNEIYSEIKANYVETFSDGAIKKDGYCFINNKSEIGFDAKLNFCSVDQLPNRLQKISKYKLLPLSKDAAFLVIQGFEKIFSSDIFRFKLFGLSYYLFPTIFMKDKSKFFETIQKASREDDNLIDRKIRLECRLENLIDNLDKHDLVNKILFTFLFAEKSDNKIILYHTIEDIAPSRIRFAAKLMNEYMIEPSNLSKYIKRELQNDGKIYIRDYISKSLTLAKYIFGKERILNLDSVLKMIHNKIMFGDNEKDSKKRELSKIINDDFKNDTNFKVHQRFLNFLMNLKIISGVENLVDGVKIMQDFENFSDIIKYKFENVELLRSNRAREFYILGVFAKFVINWQSIKNSVTIEKYLDGIGSVNLQNADRIFRKIQNGARKYSMYGETYDLILTVYTQIKSQIKSTDLISIDIANIAFVMGSVDYKNFKNN